MTTRQQYDAALHLLDRQIVDVDGLLVGNVDDVELTEEPDGSLVPTGLLVGMAALLPRLSRGLYRRWVRLAPANAERSRPGVIDIEAVAEVDSDIRLSVGRDQLIERRSDPPSGPTRHTLSELLEMRVELADCPGKALQVLDVRLAERPDARGKSVTALLVGHGRPGSYLGYERAPGRGPWLVAAVVRWMHRHSRFVDAAEVEIDWEARIVRGDVGTTPP
ncbi:hypothetical protein F0U44_12530 [Nocardioides humilatus]|uniref:PRC-barrel domain containing protein n=1 Tax=Nocardioides humilatus TaxID=2607660 RepID=A0A5B1LF26_9ACTN|nr:hypothetical protein [Nocardioides humilatus]KAA1419265.1 hypothetical protein F0U44_12530 [Nocardioides humilatus]